MAVQTPQELKSPAKNGRREAEPRVMTEDVQRILRRVVRPDDDDAGESVIMLAQRANTSARTVYRILSRTTSSISIDLADRLCLAANSHLLECRLLWPDGRVQWYLD